MQFAERRRVRGEGMDFNPDFPASSTSLVFAGYKKKHPQPTQTPNPLLFFLISLFYFPFSFFLSVCVCVLVFFVCFPVLFFFPFFPFFFFSLYFQENPHVPTGRVGRSRFAFVPPPPPPPPLRDLARRGLAVGSGCVKLSSLVPPRRKTPHVRHPVSARAGDGRG